MSWRNIKSSLHRRTGSIKQTRNNFFIVAFWCLAPAAGDLPTYIQPGFSSRSSTVGEGDFGRFVSHSGHFLTNFHCVPCKI